MIIRPYKGNDDSDLSGAKPGKELCMNREQAEGLLAALIFDDLDETSKAELVAYLQTDDELRDRLADLRMTVKLADDAVNEGPAPVLSQQRLKQLKRLARADKTQTKVFSIRRVLAVAAVLVFAFVLVSLLMPSLGRRRYSYWAPLVASDVPHSYSSASASRPATRAAPSEPSASAGTRYKMDLGQLQQGMGGMGGYGGAGGMSGREVANVPSNAPEDERIARAAGESQQAAIAMGELRNQLTTARELPRPAAPMPPKVSGGALPASVDAPVVSNSAVRQAGAGAGPDNPFQMMMGGMGSAGQKSQVVKETNGDGVVSNLRLNQDLGRRTAGAATDEMKEQVSSFRSGRGSGTSETPGKFDRKVPYGWSGDIAPERRLMPTPTTIASDSDGVFDKELNQRLGINGSVKDKKSAPVLGDVPLVGGLFQNGMQPKANAEGAGQAIGGATAYADVPSVQVQKEPVPLATSLPDFLAEAKAEQNAPSLDKAKSNAPTLTEETVNLASSSHFKVVPVNPWVMTDRDAFSTFGLDVDTASYDLCRRYVRGGFLPPVGAVRMEEFVNAFDYAYPQRDDATFAVYAEGAPSPFAPAGQDLALLKVAVKARTVGRDQRRAANLIFVVDASASMGQADRLPLVQAVSNQLVDKLSDADRVSLITCANEARLHLEAVPAGQRDAIHQTINAIQPAGPTNLLAGLKLGYEMARKSFVAGQTNQVVLCSDGVANVGQTEADAMLKEVAEDRKQAITLTCVGVGYGAYSDAFLEALADQGDGRYVFLDSSEQAQEALVGQLAGSLQNVATDARIQVQFNPNQVRRYRLIGYENRDIEDQRFRDDTVEAGAVGSGQCSTALYELELTGSRVEGVSPSNRGQDARDTDEADLGTVLVRYRNMETGQIEEISRPLANSLIRRRSVEEDPRFFLAAGAARFAEWLRQSEHAQQTSLADVQRLLDRVSADLPLDRQVQGLALLAHQAEGLPRAPEAPEGKP